MIRDWYFHIKCRIYGMICSLKKYYQLNKLHFIICFFCAACGLLIALSGTYKAESESVNFIVIIKQGARSPLPMIVNILLFSSLAHLVVFLASFHFGIFVLCYGGIIAGSLCLFRCAFISVSLDGVLGIVFFIFFIMPIYLFHLFSLSVLLCKIYDYRGYAGNKKYFINLSFVSRKMVGEVLHYYAAALICSYSVWLIIYLITLLVC
ncbi:MAG: hypothetical protein PHI19_00960 [Clostridia bacterium]|nr:hypothetical protein [Clostridia bacterium]